MSNTDTRDCIIIGAGLYGIAAANTYLEIHPNDNVLVLESRPCLGGVWSSERSYDAFWTQTPLNMARFSDSLLKTPKPEEVYHGFFPAHYVTSYLEDYADSHSYAGKSLRERIAFSTAVTQVRRDPHTESWIVTTDNLSLLSTRKLMVCAGLTSVPNMPSLPGQESLTNKIIHHRDFGASAVLEDPRIQHIAVLGGGKSAADMAYAAATAGRYVYWIIRMSGEGPRGLLPAKGIGPYRNSNEVLYTRFMAALNPSLWAPRAWKTRALHQSSIGRRILDRLWCIPDANARREAGFKHGSKPDDFDDPIYQKLRPYTTIFWGNGGGVNQRPDFWSTMASDNVDIIHEDIIGVRDNTIIMPFGTISPDIIVCGTGWRPSYHAFLDEELARKLGLASPLPQKESERTTATDQAEWLELERAADAEICHDFPRLQKPPRPLSGPPTQSPFRLYKYMVPTHPDMSGIAFLGHIVVGNHFRAAECQAQWAVAYLDGRLSLPPREEMEREVAMSIAWSRRRYLTKGALGHWLYFDLVPYTDALLEQLGLHSHRRKNMSKDFFSPCVAEDLKDLFSELREKQKSDLIEADVISNYSNSEVAMLLARSSTIKQPLFARQRHVRRRTYMPAPPRPEMAEMENASTMPMPASRIRQKWWLGP